MASGTWAGVLSFLAMASWVVVPSILLVAIALLVRQRTGGSVPKGGSACPFCGRRLRTRKGPWGEFVGCAGFPRCRYTRPADPTAVREPRHPAPQPAAPEDPEPPEPPLHWTGPGPVVAGVWGFPSTAGERRLAEAVAKALEPYPGARILAGGLWEDWKGDRSVRAGLVVVLDGRILILEYEEPAADGPSVVMGGMDEWSYHGPGGGTFPSPLARTAAELDELASFLAPLRDASRSLSLVVLPDRLRKRTLTASPGGTVPLGLPWRLPAEECPRPSLVLLERHVKEIVGGAAERWGRGTEEEQERADWCWRWLLAHDCSGNAAAGKRHAKRHSIPAVDTGVPA